MKKIWIIIVVMALISCGKQVPQCPTVAPFQSLLHSKANRLDPDVVRIFSNHSTQKPLNNMKWSPDGNTVAFLESQTGEAEGTRLWVVDVEKLRKRPLFLGDDLSITDFMWADADTLLFQSGNKIFTATLDGETTDMLNSETAVDGLSISPDKKYLAYTQKSNLFLYSVASGKESQLTHNDEAFVCSGCVSWLYDEEFETEKGIGWSPDSKKIWFRQVDQRHVPKRTVDLSEPGATETIAYSKAGESNPIVSLGVVSVEDKDFPIKWANVSGDDTAYLPDAMWHPGNSKLLVTRLDRLQTRFELLQCDESLICETVFTHTDPRWINYPGLPVFSQDGSAYALQLGLEEFPQVVLFDGDTHGHKALTHGPINVTKINGVTTNAVIFTANQKDPVSNGIYEVAVSDGVITPVNITPGHHLGQYSPDLKMFIDTYSNVNASPSVHICDMNGKPVMRIDGSENEDYRPPDEVINEFTSFESERGDVLYVHITRPKITDKNKRYPVMVYVYGGPRYQAVMNRYNTTFTAWRNLMAKRGFILFTLDNRGAAGRGREFEMAVHRNLTAAALEDQLSGIQWLKKQSYVAKDRIGIMGWSFGGTMTLNALLRTEDIFKLGVALAPVTDWRRYDSAYTERYMQRPEDNTENYDATDLTRLPAALTERLLMVHGTGDRNVLPEHTQAMWSQFVLAGKQVEMLLYPGENHSIQNQKKRAHLFSEITRFIEQYL